MTATIQDPWAQPTPAGAYDDLLVRALHLVARFYRFPDDFDMASFERAYSARRDITHRISVGRFAAQKRASMRAHASQASADGDAGDRGVVRPSRYRLTSAVAAARAAARASRFSLLNNGSFTGTPTYSGTSAPANAKQVRLT